MSEINVRTDILGIFDGIDIFVYIKVVRYRWIYKTEIGRFGAMFFIGKRAGGSSEGK